MGGVQVTDAPVDVGLAPDVSDLVEGAQRLLQVMKSNLALATGFGQTCQQRRGAPRGHQVLGVVEDRLHLREQRPRTDSIARGREHRCQVRGRHCELPLVVGLRAQPTSGLEVRDGRAEVVELVASSAESRLACGNTVEIAQLGPDLHRLPVQAGRRPRLQLDDARVAERLQHPRL